MRHPAIVVRHGPADRLYVAPVSHAYIAPSVEVTNIAPSSCLTGFIYVGRLARVNTSNVKVDKAGRAASEQDVRRIRAATSTFSTWVYVPLTSAFFTGKARRIRRAISTFTSSTPTSTLLTWVSQERRELGEADRRAAFERLWNEVV